MRDKLKDFVDSNRNAFDCVDAPYVFAAVQGAVAAKKTIVSSKLSKIMIKFSIGASTIVATTLVIQHYFNPKPAHAASHLQAVKTELPAQTNEEVVENSPQYVEKLQTPAIESSIKYTSESLAFPVDSSPAPLSSTETQAQVATPLQKSEALLGNYADTLFTGVKKIKLRVDYCTVELLKSADDKVHLQAYISESCGSTITLGRKHYTKSIARLKQEQSGSELTLWTETETTTERREIDNNDKPSKITLSVPNNLQIEIDNGSGAVIADGIVTQSMRVETHFGSITCTSLKGDLNLIANSGSVKAQDLSGQIKVRTEFGSIKLDRIVGETDVNSSSGSLTIHDVEGSLEVRSTFGSQKISKVKGPVKSISSSGSVKMADIIGAINCVSSFGTQFYDNIKGEITAQSSSGSIQLNEVTGKLNLTSSFGSIKGNAITLLESATLKASSGSIRLDFLNNSSELTYDLSSSSGSISIEQDGNKITGTEDLKIGTGKLLVSGVTTFGSQSYRLQKTP